MPNINFDSELYVSLDGGVKFTTLYAGQALEVEPKAIRQIVIKSNVADLPYKAIFDFEIFDDQG